MPAFTHKLATTYKDTGPTWVPPQEANLEMWLPFSSNFTDSSGNGRDCTVGEGTPTIIADPEGGGRNCLDLDGSSRLFMDVNPAGLGGGTTMSFGGWARPETYGEGNYGRMINHQDQSSSDYVISTYITDQNAEHDLLVGVFGPQTGSVVRVANVITLEEWFHFFYTRKSGEGILYVNGIDVGNHATTTYTTLKTSTNPVDIGDRKDFVRKWNGQLRNLMIYRNALLTPAEVIDIRDNT